MSEILKQALERLEEEAILYHDQAWYDQEAAKVLEQAEKAAQLEARRQKERAAKFFQDCVRDTTVMSVSATVKEVRRRLLKYKDDVLQRKRKTLQEALQAVLEDFQEKLQTAQKLGDSEPVKNHVMMSPEIYNEIEGHPEYISWKRNVWKPLISIVSSYHQTSGGYAAGVGYSTGYGWAGNYSPGSSHSTLLVPETDSFAELQQSAVQFCEEAIVFLQLLLQEQENEQF